MAMLRNESVVLVRFYEWKRTSKKCVQPFFAYFSDNGPTEEMLELATLEKEEVCVCVCVCVCVVCVCVCRVHCSTYFTFQLRDMRGREKE